MSLRHRFATWMSVVAAALAGVLVVANPVRAEGEVAIEIDGLADSVRAGDRFDDFRAVFTNTSGAAISGVFAVVTVSLPGAPMEAIYVQRTGGGALPGQPAGEGAVTFTDPTPFDLGRGGGNARRRVDFQIAFSAGAPDGDAMITVAAYADGQMLGSAHASTRVRGGAGPTTPPNTDPGIVPTFEAGPTYSIAPLTDVAAMPVGGATVPKTLYVLGSLLVAIGLMTLLLVLRPPGLHHAGHAAAAAPPGPRRPMRWPHHAPAGAPAHPRPAQPGRAGADAAPPWPAVAPPRGAAPAGGPPPPSGSFGGPPPLYRPGPPRDSGPHTTAGWGGGDRGPGPGWSGGDRGPHTGTTGRVVDDRGPHTGMTRPVRSPAPDDSRRHYE